MNRTFLLAGICMLVVSAGCKIPKTLLSSGSNIVPESYKGHADSAAGKTLIYNQFFADHLLTALIDTALANNADLQIAFQRVESAKANLSLYRGALYPSLGIGLGAGGNQYGRYTMNGAGNVQTSELPSPFVPDYLAGVTVGWEADIWGKLKNKKKAAQLRYLGTEAGKNFVRSTLITEVAYHYYALAAFDEELEIIYKNTALQDRALEIVKMQKEGGRATELAVKQFTAQLAKTQSLQYQLKMNIAETENELNFLLGRYARPIGRDTTTFDAAILSPGISVPSALLHRRPDIIQSELALRASEADVAAARAEFLPLFNITATAGYNAYNLTSLFNPLSFAYGIAGNIAAPVLNRNAIRANYKMLLAEQKGASLQYGRTVMNAVFEVCTALEEIENLKGEYELNLKAASALNDAVTIANDLYLAGYATYLEVITAQRNAVDAELEAVQTRKKILFANINLYRSLGGN